MDEKTIGDGISLMSIKHPRSEQINDECDICGFMGKVSMFPSKVIGDLNFKKGIHELNLYVCDLCLSTYALESFGNDRDSMMFKILSTMCYIGNEILDAIKSQKS